MSSTSNQLTSLPLVMMVVVVMMLTHIMKQWHDKSGYEKILARVNFNLGSLIGQPVSG